MRKFAVVGPINESVQWSSWKREHANHRVVSVEWGNEEDVWDIEVEGTHTFIGNGIALHNSSSTPNLQNLAGTVRRAQAEAAYGAAGLTRVGAYALRRGIVARPGYVLAAIDYQQQEARLFALLAGDANLLARVRGAGDVHADVAALVWGSRDPTHRRWAKDLTFALCYGMTTDSLAEMLAVTPGAAARITGQYFRAFPRVQPDLRETARRCEHRGYTRYWSGRIWRPFNARHSYKAVNAEVQGGCAELLSVAALRCAAWLKERGCGHLVLLVHDELVFELQRDSLPEAVPALQALMAVEDVFGIAFPTSTKVGQNYGEMTTWET
jgi:DNA polymerase-1